ncbi:MAG: ATP-binding cassette domain-containing protein [Alsobacter sp.]
MTLDVQSAGPAVRLAGVVKRYPMYDSPVQLAADQLGLYRLPFLRRGPFPQFTALAGIDLVVDHGERIGIVGRNGSGKTTLLKLITGAIAPTQGEILRSGSVQALMNTSGGFHPELTGRQNIEAALAQAGLVGNALCAAAADVVAFSELGPHLDQPFGTFSLGMQARTQFAVATAIRPESLVIDEVLGAGDGYFAAKSAARMKDLVSSGCTLLLVSHDATQILQYCTRAVWLRDGVIYRDGPTRDVLAAYQADMEDMSAAHAGVAASPVEAVSPFDLPASLNTDFVDQAIRAAEPVEGSPVPVERPRGRTIFSYPGREGLRLADVELSSDPARATGLAVGDTLIVRANVSCTRSGHYRISPRLLIYSLSGERFGITARTTLDLGPLSEGQKAAFAMRLERLLFGAQHYILSLLIEDADDPAPDDLTHFDLWSRFGYLSYAPTNDSDPPLVHMDGQWCYPDGSPERARLAAHQ